METKIERILWIPTFEVSVNAPGVDADDLIATDGIDGALFGNEQAAMNAVLSAMRDDNCGVTFVRRYSSKIMIGGIKKGRKFTVKVSNYESLEIEEA